MIAVAPLEAPTVPAERALLVASASPVRLMQLRLVPQVCLARVALPLQLALPL